MLDLLLSTLRTLRAHALRFVLTGLGIVWGAFMLTFLTATMEGINDHFIRELEEAGPKFVIVFPGAVLKNRVGERGARRVEIENEDVERLLALDSIEDASHDMNLWSQIIRAGRRTKLFNVNAIGFEAARIRNLVPEEGRFLSPLDIDRGARVAYLGAVARERLFGAGPAVGSRIQIESVAFRVVGVNEAKDDQMMGINGWDDWSVFIPYTTAQRWLLRSDVVTKMTFAPVTREGSWEAIRHTRQLLGLHHGFHPDLDTAVSFFNSEQEYFSDGITEDIITELSRFSWIKVIARNSSFSFKGQAVDLRTVARELGVRYVLEGSVRKAGNRVRVTAQLIDADDGSHLWAERYDRDLDDIFEIQDEITCAIVSAIAPHMQHVEISRAAGRRPEDLDCWDLVMRAMGAYSSFSKEGLWAMMYFSSSQAVRYQA